MKDVPNEEMSTFVERQTNPMSTTFLHVIYKVVLIQAKYHTQTKSNNY
jgi:hypothetical protein